VLLSLIVFIGVVMSEGGFAKYLSFMADWSAAALTPEGRLIDAEDQSEEDLRLIDDLFKRYTEITGAIDNLELSLIFIQGRMPRKKGLKLDAYLVYHITFYIQEIYILNERLDSYAKTVMRGRGRLGERVDKGAYNKLLAWVRQALSNIVQARGAHVHDRAFADNRMRGLSLFSFMANHSPNPRQWSEQLRDEYADVRRRWVVSLKRDRVELDKILDRYFEFILSEVTGGSLAIMPSLRLKSVRDAVGGGPVAGNSDVMPGGVHLAYQTPS